MNNGLKRLIAVLMIFTITISLFFVCDATQNDNSIETMTITNDKLTSSIIQYSYYYEKSKDYIELPNPIELLNTEKKYVKGDEDTFYFNLNNPTAFILEFFYTSLKKENPEISIKIDDEYPFFESQYVSIPTYWEDDGDIRIDNHGNEFAPEQKVSTSFVKGYAGDYTNSEKPFTYLLNPGKHTITLIVNNGEFYLNRFTMTNLEKTFSYKKPSENTKTTDSIVIEAENAFQKSSMSLIAKADENSVDITPNDYSVAKVNYIGGSNWSSLGDTISWNFDVKESGYYSLGFMYRQSELLGGVSYRHLMIDGKTPFAEAENIKFKYCSSWKYYEFSDKNDPYYFYLDSGKHTISLSVTCGSLIDIYQELKDISSIMGDLYVDITMIVGETVDVSRSYELFNQIPNFNNRLSEAKSRLTDVVKELEEIQEKSSGSTVSTLNNAIVTLKNMIDNPYKAHKYKSSFYSDYTNISSLLGTITDMPLDIDRIFIIGKNSSFENPQASFIDKTIFSINRFLISFTSDYSKTEKNKSNDELTIWVNWGRDQVQVLDAMIQSDFAAKEGIKVNVQLVNATILQAILSGDGPDVMLRMSRTEPVNLAMRGGLYNLKEFDDYDEVMSRFVKDSDVSYQYKNGVYALPDTMGFNMMFVRTDILEGLGLSIPKTWDEFINVMAILQHNNLQVSLPYTQIADSSTVNAGVGALTLYPTLLLQRGLCLYNDTLTASTLTEQPQIDAFKYWTNLYTKYKVPVTVSFYNRFRIGSVPIGIASYATYTQFKAAAPEIEGRWTVTKLPGTRKEDGTIDYSSAGSGTGCAITKLSKNPENAWKFLKWWTSSRVQLKYSNSVEAILGPLGRTDTANVEALENMNWDNEMKNLLIEQMKCVKQIPEVPGGYYLARGIDQAFWNVTEQNADPTDQLLEWGKIVDREIARKEKEFS